MSFSTEGSVQLVVGDVVFAEPRFAQGKGPNDFDICIEVTHSEDNAQHDWARLEWSENYGKGNFATQTQKEITMSVLHKIGFQGNDLLQIKPQLEGKTVPGFVKATEKDGNTYYNVYLGGGGGNAPKEALDPQEVVRRLTGGGATTQPAQAQPQQAAAQPAPTTTDNPFA